MYTSRRLLKSQSFSHNDTDGNEQKGKPRSASFTQSKSLFPEKLLFWKITAPKVCNKNYFKFTKFTSENISLYWSFGLVLYPIIKINISFEEHKPEIHKHSLRGVLWKGVPTNFAKFAGKQLCLNRHIIKVTGWKNAKLLKKNPAQVFSCEFYEIFKNTHFAEHLRSCYCWNLMFYLSSCGYFSQDYMH